MADNLLEQLNRQVADSAADVEAAEKNWLSATDPRLRAHLEKVYDDAKEKEKRLVSRLAAMEAKHG